MRKYLRLQGCDNTLCDHYSVEHGYICRGCLSELKAKCEELDSIKQFMYTPKVYYGDFTKRDNKADRINIINQEFDIGE